MNFHEWYFLLLLVSMLAITALRTYNVLTNGNFYTIKYAFLLAIGAILSYGLYFSAYMLYADNMLFYQILMLQTLLIGINGLYMIVELIIYPLTEVVRSASEGQIKPFNAIENREKQIYKNRLN